MKINKLTDRKILSLKKPGLHSDGGGLYIQVSKMMTLAWIYRYTFNGKARKQGLGAYPHISTTNARELASTSRMLVMKGVDPLVQKAAQRKEDHLSSYTFQDAAVAFYQIKKQGWKQTANVKRWLTMMQDHTFDSIGAIPVAALTTKQIADCLAPIWLSKTSTAKLVQQRIHSVIEYVFIGNDVDRRNPGALKALETLLPAATISKVHRPSLPFDQVPAFYQSLGETPAELALRLIILTGVRSSEACNIVPGEVTGDVWTIPAERMKGGTEHLVPLSGEVLRILSLVSLFSEVNPDTVRRGVLQKHHKVSVHGFRTSLKQWAIVNNYPDVISEAALAHKMPSAAMEAYTRGGSLSLLDARREMMDAWAVYLTAC